MRGIARGLAFSFAAIVTGCAYDPSPGIFQTKQTARNLECTRLSQAEAHERFPGTVPEAFPRGPYITVDALTCSTRITEKDDRPARDEVILTSLRQSVAEINRLAATLVPDNTTWHVDTFYPQAAVAQKISVAARTDLVERGNSVSDRVPVLAAGDIAVLARMDASKSYPLACKRYFAQKVLVEPDVFLGLMIIDARETDLHAGLCMRGQWKWLQ